MASVLVIGIVDIVLAVAGIGMMIPGLLPQKRTDPSHTTVVRVGAGMHGLKKEIDASNTAGTFPDVRLYDGAGRFVGRNSDWPHVDAGGFKEVTISHESGMDGVQSEYMAISAAFDDAICINWVSMTWPGGERFGFLGDIGTMCGADWYYSDVLTANWDSSTTESPILLNRSSNCIWIDRDYSYGLRHQGIGIHMIDFSSSKDPDKDGRASQYHDHPETMCSSQPRFHMYKKMSLRTPIPYFWPKLGYKSDNSDADRSVVTNNKGRFINKRRSTELGDNEKRSKNNTGPFMAGTVVKSPNEQHSAKEICKSGTSKGPDFVSLAEGFFCDMDRKEVWPLCSAIIVHGCFDVDTNKMRPGPLSQRSINGRTVPDKSYHTEIKWGGN